MNLKEFPNKRRYMIYNTYYERGIIDRKKNTIIEPIYDNIVILDDRYFLVYDKDRSGLINVDGKIIIKLGFWKLRINNKINYYNKSYLHKEYIVASWSNLSLNIYYPNLMSKFNQDVIKIDDTVHNTFGFISKDDELLLEPIYKSIDLLKNGIGIICTENYGYRYGLIDKNYKIIRKAGFSFIDNSHWQNEFSNVVVDSDKEKGLINIYGKIILDINFTNIKKIDNGFFIVEKYMFGLVNYKGEIILDIEYKNIIFLKKEKIFLLEKQYRGHSTFGFADKNGKITIYPEFNFRDDNKSYLKGNVFKDKEDFLLVRKNGQSGLINKEGKYKLPPIYDNIEINKIFFRVQKKDKNGLIDYNGKMILNIEWESITFLKESIVFIKDKQFGVINYDGKIILDYGKYWESSLEIREHHKYGKELIEYGTIFKTGLINSKGESIIPLTNNIKYNLIYMKMFKKMWS
jgi:hypothetical protein